MNDSIGEHTDWGLFTLLQANAPGLEVDIDGEWVAVDGSDPPWLLVQNGDLLAAVTGWRSAPHRVRRTTAPRASLAFFGLAEPQAVLTGPGGAARAGDVFAQRRTRAPEDEQTYRPAAE